MTESVCVCVRVVCQVKRSALHREAGAATNATSHGRRSFLVVMAASRRSRQRPSPLRGGHGRGLCPFVVVTAEVFFTPTQKQRKNRFTCDFRLFNRRNLLGVCASSRHLRRHAHFRRNRRGKTKQAEKSHRHWPWAVVMWRSSPRRLGRHGVPRRSFADTAGGHGRRLFLVF